MGGDVVNRIYVYDYIKSKICLETELSVLSLSMSSLSYNAKDTQMLNEKIKSVRTKTDISPENFFNITINFISSYEKLEIFEKPLDELIEMYIKEDIWTERGKEMIGKQFK